MGLRGNLTCTVAFSATPNAVGCGRAHEPDSLVLELLRGLRADVADVKDEVVDLRADIAAKSELADAKAWLKADIHSVRADVASDLLTTRKEHGDQIAGLRRAVIEYHSAVIGHACLSASSKRGCAGWNSISISPLSTRTDR